MKFFITTYGCQMNVHESEKLSSVLTSTGYERVDAQTDADIIIFNTCCIRNTAEQKIISHIGETKRLKEANPNKLICVAGCLSQRDAEGLIKKFPHIDVLMGTHNITELGIAIDERLCTKKRVVRIKQQREMNNDNLIPAVPHKGDVAYVNITYGCENYCSYCIVPFVRGKLVCREFDVIEKEMHEVLAQKNLSKPTIWLLGQNVNSYICPKTGTDFGGLLKKLSQIDSDFMMNFLSAHPKDFTFELIDIIASLPKIQRDIHLPIQSGCDETLHNMNRKYTVADFRAKIDYMRRVIPGVKVTTDVICGFPGETQEHHETTMRTVEDIGFNAAYVFPYSRRTGTVADKMDGQVDTKTKRARTTEIVNLMRRISKTK